MTRTMPKQNPGASEQVVRTPPEFLQAVERRFGRIKFDLAANAENSVAGVDVPPVTIREQIERGPKFEAERTFLADPPARCACGDGGPVDVTGLCRPCWRAWRWSPCKESGLPGRPVQVKGGTAP